MLNRKSDKKKCQKDIKKKFAERKRDKKKKENLYVRVNEPNTWHPVQSNL